MNTNYFNYLTNLNVFAFVMLALFSCKESDDFFSNQEDKSGNIDKTDYFDFSTTRGVDLIVDYSDFDIHGPVKFSIYNVNPIVNENDYDEYVDESIEPIFEAYTDSDGKFDETITLPAYAKVLHIVTGNFMIGLKRKAVEVINGVANMKLSADESSTSAQNSPATRAPGPGENVNSLAGMKGLSFNYTNNAGAIGTRIYNDWHTPLGTWNSATGRPNYLLDPSTASPELVFSSEVMDGLYATACEALNSGTTCKEDYRANSDLTLLKESEVCIAALGSMTCWNSSFGYYYYTAEKAPKSRSDLNIIMLFPNTQDGHRYTPKFGSQYQNNIGMVRGDMIQLMYYPNIAKGDYSNASKVFPKGTKIGFLLKPNGWSDQGDAYITCNGSKKMNSKMNIWAASTEGMSYSDSKLATYKYPNTTGEARTAKFAYTSPNGNSYSIVSVEDACDDKDYDDLLFALNPANVFAELPQVAVGKTTSHGVYAFEDMWPSRGDYDMNDVLVDCQHDMAFSKGKVKYETYSLTTYQNYVSMTSGLALKLKTKVTPQSIELKRINPGSSKATTATTFVKEGDYYFLTDNISKQLGTTYVFKITYSTPQDVVNLATIEPFIYRDEEDGKRWEVHLPYTAPTSKMNMSYFGTGDDRSNTSSGAYYVREGYYPFAFYLANAKADNFINNILVRANESKPIDSFFPEFIGWSVSKGAKNEDWYLHPAGE